MGGKRTTTQNTNQTQTVAPPSFTMPGIEDASRRVTAALGQLPTTTYGGDFVAQPGVDQGGALSAYRAAAARSGELGGWLQGQMGAAQQPPAFTTTLPTNRFELAPAQNLEGVIGAAINPVFRELTENILPGIRSSALESGAYSGDRAMSVVPGQAIQQSNEAAQRLAAQIGYEDYNNRENRRLTAFTADEDRALAGYQADTQRGLGVGDLLTQRMGQLPELVDTIMRMESGRGDLLRIAGDLETSGRQAGIDNELAREQYGVTRPFMGLDMATQLLARLSGNYGTTNMKGRTQTTEETGGLGPLVQGAMGLASLAAGFPGVGQALGLTSAAARAAVPMASQIFRPPPIPQPAMVGPR